MEPNTQTSHPEDAGSAQRPPDRPRASDWLWKPWYARVLWGSCAVYWAGALGSFWSPALDRLYTTALAGYLNLLFYPLTPLLVLGVGFVHAWMDFKGLEWGPPNHEQLFPKRSVGGFLDPMADPLDPRSPLYLRKHR